MILWFLRALFILSMGGIGYHISILTAPGEGPPLYPELGIIIGVGVAILVIVLEWLIGGQPIHIISSVVFGVIAGCLIAFMLYGVVHLVVGSDTHELFGFGREDIFKRTILLVLVTVFGFLGIVFVYRTRDSFRFIIPYVEFRKDMKGVRPFVLDTSAIVDGRISEIARTGILDGPLLVPKFVLQELHTLADSADTVRRKRGRRGLDMLQRLQREVGVEVNLHDGREASGSDVDTKVISLASALGAAVVTCDYNMAKIAEVQNVNVINVNDLANAMRPIALPGEELEVKVIRQGDEPNQGVGFLPDGTMVVLEKGRDKIGQNVRFITTSVLQTTAGRMIFGRLKDDQK